LIKSLHPKLKTLIVSKESVPAQALMQATLQEVHLSHAEGFDLSTVQTQRL
jgi:hypothetical protein